jgi:hypothetical protein
VRDLFKKINTAQNIGVNPPFFGCLSDKKPAEKTPFSSVYLGTYTKSSPAHERRGFQLIKSQSDSLDSADKIRVDFDTGEIIQDSLKYDPVSVRLERYALQSAVRKLLPLSRTSKCLRYLLSDPVSCSGVGIKKSVSHGSVFYAGLQVCSSVWSCPVCAAKISERRRIEVLSAIDSHERSGHQVFLLTLTVPHSNADDLSFLLKAQALAMSRFNSLRSAKKLWNSIDCIGTIRAWEVTHGVNGWHPHFHVLVFCSYLHDLESLESCFYDLWANCCRLARLPIPSLAYGVKLDNGLKAAEYVTKGVWGLDHEITKGHLKKSKKGRSPFDLLRSYMIDKDKSAGVLFVEYAAAFKGKRQLVWSKGLKLHFNCDDLTDADIADRIDDDALLLGLINFDDWLLILRFDLRALILELARHGWDAVNRCIVGLRKNDKQNEKK